MIRDRQKIPQKPHNEVLNGCNPGYDFDSSYEDGFNRTLLSEVEFNSICNKAREDRKINLESERNTIHNFSLESFIENILKNHEGKKIGSDVVNNALKNAISIDILVNNLAEAFRVSNKQIEQELSDLGLSEMIDLHRIKNLNIKGQNNVDQKELIICDNCDTINPFPDLFNIICAPNFSEPIFLDENQNELINNLFKNVSKSIVVDPFIKLYRENVLGYYQDFMTNLAPELTKTINEYFRGSYPKYMVTTGIGANEQFSHFVAARNNTDKNKRLNWLIINSTKKLSLLPSDATIENTLFIEFSRSSLTEETVKIHEYTQKEAKRIVFSNKGPLREIAIRDGNLVLEFPDEISGRFGRNKTPILLAPMLIAGMNVESYWKDIDFAIKTFDINNPNSLPFALAKFIFLHQKLNNRNFIYLGCNDDTLGLLADEFIQFWNEGVNKCGNDLLTSRFFGLPRDSHMNIEGVLGNRESKLGLFLLRTNMRTNDSHPLISSIIDPINPDHQGLQLGDEEVVISYANYKRFSELMPSILISIPSEPSLKHSAILGQLFADTTFIYSRLKGIDPGSNPEVKMVRERSAELLSKVAQSIRNGRSIQESILNMDNN